MVLVEEVLGSAVVVLAEGNETKGAEVISAAKAVFARKLHSRRYMAPPHEYCIWGEFSERSGEQVLLRGIWWSWCVVEEVLPLLEHVLVVVLAEGCKVKGAEVISVTKAAFAQKLPSWG